jgi:hypothetical protein
MNMGIHGKRQGDRQIIALGIIEQGKRSFQQTGLVFLPAAIFDRRHIGSGTHRLPLKPFHYDSFYKHHFLKLKEIFDYPKIM